MNQLQIEALRDFAIDSLPRATADRKQASKHNSSARDFYNALATTAVMVRSRASTTAIEYSAANVLESVAILCAEREEKLSKAQLIMLQQRIIRDAKELCTLTGRKIDWLETLPTVPEPEEEEEPPATKQYERPDITGRLLDTKEAAELMGYAPQTLRTWASKQTGPITPLKQGNRLKWRGDDLLAFIARK